MFASMKAFMGQIIDYAGLFPPAALPLESAIRHYAAYRSGPDGWMLGNFVLAAAQLPAVGCVHAAVYCRTSAAAGGGNRPKQVGGRNPISAARRLDENWAAPQATWRFDPDRHA
ncbi:MAG: hypothetical protein J7639_29460 [Paenibacillaceae bacterium]|nr:hypothetical protein [Paenibacillaceae bacterium]